MTKNILRDIYVQLQTIGILDDSGSMKHSYMRFASEGLMDLHVDKLFGSRISVAHNGVLNGDIMADPDMEVLINPERQEAEAQTFQNDYLGIYQEPEDKRELNVFLHDWLCNIINAEYKLAETEE
ncbi:hypothetical protein [Methanosarcina sp.]|uniref:DUF6908 domain-containing protein n=1 Tax=Methanosarcina sp. TaxID=2213 RepID=UPI002C053151|nr:hypothetical protein [Methanosarcina sp.]HOW13512.1 hypothetical protein [Methanosarcina sp.]